MNTPVSYLKVGATIKAGEFNPRGADPVVDADRLDASPGKRIAGIGVGDQQVEGVGHNRLFDDFGLSGANPGQTL